MKSALLTIIALFLVTSCSKIKLTAPKAPEKKVDFFEMAWAKNLDPEYISGNLPIGLPLVFMTISFIREHSLAK